MSLSFVCVLKQTQLVFLRIAVGPSVPSHRKIMVYNFTFLDTTACPWISTLKKDICTFFSPNRYILVP